MHDDDDRWFLWLLGFMAVLSAIVVGLGCWALVEGILWLRRQ